MSRGPSRFPAHHARPSRARTTATDPVHPTIDLVARREQGDRGAVEPLLKDPARAAVRAAIEAIELRTAAELVVAVQRRSQLHALPSAVLGVLAAIAVQAALLFSEPEFPLDWFIVAPLAAGTLAALLGRLAPLQRLLTPARLRRSGVLLAAQATFYRRQVGHTRDHTGALVFLSLTERQCEVVADTGLLRVRPLEAGTRPSPPSTAPWPAAAGSTTSSPPSTASATCSPAACPAPTTTAPARRRGGRRMTRRTPPRRRALAVTCSVWLAIGLAAQLAAQTAEARPGGGHTFSSPSPSSRSSSSSYSSSPSRSSYSRSWSSSGPRAPRALGPDDLGRHLLPDGHDRAGQRHDAHRRVQGHPRHHQRRARVAAAHATVRVDPDRRRRAAAAHQLERAPAPSSDPPAQAPRARPQLLRDRLRGPRVSPPRRRLSAGRTGRRPRRPRALPRAGGPRRPARGHGPPRPGQRRGDRQPLRRQGEAGRHAADDHRRHPGQRVLRVPADLLPGRALDLRAQPRGRHAAARGRDDARLPLVRRGLRVERPPPLRAL